MTEKFGYDDRTYLGATAEDWKVIHLALSEKKADDRRQRSRP